MSTYQTTLKDNSGNELLPKTVLKAIADDNGYYLDSALTAADINALKNGTLNNAVRHNNETPGTPPSINAGQLNGHYDSYFATESEIDIVRGQSQAYDPSETYDIGDYAIHTDILYRCLNNGVTGVFDATKWEVVDLTTLKDEVETNKTDIATNASAITSLNTEIGKKANYKDMGVISSQPNPDTAVANWLIANNYPTGVFGLLISGNRNVCGFCAKSEGTQKYRVLCFSPDTHLLFGFTLDSDNNNIANRCYISMTSGSPT